MITPLECSQFHPGGGGLYYFSTYILVQSGENAEFNIVVNDVIICTVYGDGISGPDEAQASCSAVVDVADGKARSTVWEPCTQNAVSIMNRFKTNKVPVKIQSSLSIFQSLFMIDLSHSTIYTCTTSIFSNNFYYVTVFSKSSILLG